MEGGKMKSLHILLSVLIFSLLASCAAEKKNELEGVWELVSGKYTSPDTTFEYSDWEAIKVITKSYFATVDQKPNRPKFSEGGTDSELLAAYKTFIANGGKYTLEGDTYTEHLKFFSNPNLVNTSASFKYQVKGDQLILSGKFLTEVWKRIE